MADLTGDYTKPAIDFPKYACDYFRPLIIPRSALSTYGRVGCGFTALALVAGTHPSIIKDLCLMYDRKESSGLTSKTAQRVLFDLEVDMIPITDRDLNPEQNRHQTLLTDRHVLLYRQYVAKDETSWFVYWGGMEWHNFEQREMNAFHYMSHTPVERFLLHSPLWNYHRQATDYFDKLRARIEKIESRTEQLKQTATEQIAKLTAAAEEMELCS